ncbi:hypothetical protein [Granulicella cerasi]|nr:hypothetical protein [Granulicella cerasi]
MLRRPQLFACTFFLSFAGVAPFTLAAQTVDPQAATQNAAPQNATPESDGAQPDIAKPVASAAAIAPVKMPVYVKNGKKEEYVGPAEIIALPPTPMLDEEGKQRVDPDGKLMFNAPVKQQRDKKGNPFFNEKGMPVFQTAADLGYDQHGKKMRAEKVKPPKLTPLSIARGTFTVDGVVGKAELNYEIADLQFLYLYVPGLGVTVVSNHAFPGAKEQKNAFDGNTLTVKADDHTLQLSGEKRLLGKVPTSAFVVVNRDFALPSRFPVVGYGAITRSPYNWPGSHANQQIAGVTAPPVPRDLQPQMALKACPAGQMRMPGPAALPGQVLPPQPCAPLAVAQAAQKAWTAKQAARAAAATAPAPVSVATTPVATP